MLRSCIRQPPTNTIERPTGDHDYVQQGVVLEERKVANTQRPFGIAIFLLLLIGLFIGATSSSVAIGADGSLNLALTVNHTNELTIPPPERDADKADDAGEGDESDKADEADEVAEDKSEKTNETSSKDDSPKEETKPEASTSASADTQPAGTQPAGTQPSKAEEADNADTSQVEIYIPSIAALTKAAAQSKTADIFEAIAGMFPKPRNDTDEGPDFAAMLRLVEQIADWPDTAIVVTVFSQDLEGRSRWAVRVDWPLDELKDRIERLLAMKEADQVLENVELRESEDGTYRLELPDNPLAVLTEFAGGSLIASSDDLNPPETVFGQPDPAKDSQSKRKSKKKKLVYCRLSLEGGDDKNSPFASIPGVRNVSYGLSLRKDGQWDEKFVLVWNPAIGAALKTFFQKARTSFECPRDAYALAAFHVGGGGGMADAVSGLPNGTIGARAGSEVAFAATPGIGFFPWPDIFFQFTARKKAKIIEDLREFIEKDTKTRKDDDRPPAWYEEQVDGQVVFWHDPTADAHWGIMPVTFRTVLFFEGTEPQDDDKEDGDEKGDGKHGNAGDAPEEESTLRLIVAQTSTWADDAVHHWQKLTKTRRRRVTIPDSDKAHWQARINWKSIYALAQPYLCLLAAAGEEATLPATAEELDDALEQSIINIRIEMAGVKVSHRGPIPFGAVYVPGVTILSLGSAVDPSSEAGRERVACRHLRVLYHHAELFKKDYGRWPATVAELDGYVDFATHADLLRLRSRDKSFVESLALSLSSQKEETPLDEEERIDDSLYEIEWSSDAWKLKFRDGTFNNHLTILIDQDGEIHKIPKPKAEGAAADQKAEDTKAEETKTEESKAEAA